MAERRSNKRKREETICPIAIMVDGQHLCGSLVDISKSGAKFRIFDTDREVSLKQGEEHDYTIYTNYGDSECRAVIMWIDRPEGDYLWGVRFTHLPEDDEDPLRRIIQSLP
jgi:c-di-GMP-binding flagellar brake protein YcgR